MYKISVLIPKLQISVRIYLRRPKIPPVLPVLLLMLFLRLLILLLLPLLLLLAPLLLLLVTTTATSTTHSTWHRVDILQVQAVLHVCLDQQ